MAPKHDADAAHAAAPDAKKPRVEEDAMDPAQAEIARGVGRLAKIGEGVWSWTVPFTFKNDEWEIPLINRCLVVHIPAKQALAIVSPCELVNEVEADVHALEAELDAPVKYLIAPNDWHYLFLGAHLKAFPAAKAYVPPGRVPSKLKDDVPYTVLDYEAPTVLDELAPALVVLPLRGYAETEDAKNQVKHGRREFMFYIASMKAIANVDTLFYFALGLNSLPDMFKEMGMTEGTIHWHFHGADFIKNYKEVIASFASVASWDFDTFISLHGPPGNIKVTGAKADIVKLLDWVCKCEKNPPAPQHAATTHDHDHAHDHGATKAA